MRKFKFIVQHDVVIEASTIDEANERLRRLDLGHTLGAEADADEQTVITGGRLVGFTPPAVARLEEL
ncbi:MAG: hypothetical protein CL398_09345 [Acidiferrobacteraceae bacterium]|nr:hypothetical protein [Acidiferrobacteraceae bacterium]